MMLISRVKAAITCFWGPELLGPPYSFPYTPYHTCGAHYRHLVHSSKAALAQDSMFNDMLLIVPNASVSRGMWSLGRFSAPQHDFGVKHIVLSLQESLLHLVIREELMERLLRNW